MSELQYLSQFREQIVQFIDELIENFPNYPEFILIRVFIKDRLPIVDILGRFISEILQYRQLVYNKEPQFFESIDCIYDIFGENGKILKKIWETEVTNDDDRDTIWQWMTLFCKLAMRYYKKYGFIDDWKCDPSLLED
jgi:hypothetical protein